MGLAVDVGTTSVVAYLVDFASGRVIDTASAYNKQIACGEDVISRIIYAKRKGGLERLQRLVVETINELLDELQARNGIELYEIHEIAVAGNTTMTHLLLGLDPQYLREEPYIPTHRRRRPSWWPASSACSANMLARVHILPSVGSYVGGDITAGVISLGHVRHRQAHPVHRHRHQRRDGARHQGLAALLRLLRRPRLRGRRRAATACAPPPAPSRTSTSTTPPGSPPSAPSTTPRPWASAAAASSTCSASSSSPGCSTSRGTSTARRPTARVRVRDGVPEYVVCRAGEGGARPRHRAHRVGHQQPDPRQGGDLRRLRGALPQRRRRPRRRGADPHRRRLRPVHQRREGHPHRPAARPAGGALPLPRQHQRPGRLRGAAVREHRATTSSTWPPR